MVVGLVATGFALGAEWANHSFQQWVTRYPLAPFVICPIGLIVVSWLTRIFFKGSQGSGIPQSIAALQIREQPARNALLSFRIAIGKIVLTIMGLFSGASIGSGGPMAHIGAAIMFSLSRFASFPRHYMDRGLILAGGAAGIAAAFHAPLAGILFAIEELGRSFEERTSSVLLTAVFLAGITAITLEGNYHYFGSTSSALPMSQVLLPVICCGVIGGLFGGLFSTTLLFGTKRIAPYLGRRPILVASICGLGIATAGFLSGNTAFGTGYDEARALIDGSSELPASYPFTKMMATIFSYLSGIPGGIFAPSLATGAGIGANIASWLTEVPASTIIVLGMVAYFTGVVQTPITAVVLLMEITDNHALLLPLIATSFIAFATSRLVCPDPIYRILALQFLPPPIEPANQEPTTEMELKQT